MKIEKTDTVYRYLGGTAEDGIMSCGYIRKITAAKSQIDFVIPYYSCFVLLRGSGQYWDSQGRTAELTPGSVVQRLPGLVHSTRVEGDGRWLEYYVSLGRSTFSSLESLGLIDQNQPVRRIEVTAELASSCDLLLQEMKQVRDSQLFRCHAKLQQLSIAMLREGAPESGATWETAIESAASMLSGPWKQARSAKQVARDLNLGYETFRKRFRDQFGMSPTQYQMDKRMMIARLMLLSGQSVKAVAKELGYSDLYAFSKQFKKHTGISPSEIGNA